MKRENGNPPDPDHYPEKSPNNASRRVFLRNGAAAIGAVTPLSINSFATAAMEDKAGKQQGGSHPALKASTKASSFLDVLRFPDAVTAFERFEQTLPAGIVLLTQDGEQWAGRCGAVESRLERDALVLTLTGPSIPIVSVHVRWNMEVRPDLRVLGDAWE